MFWFWSSCKIFCQKIETRIRETAPNLWNSTPESEHGLLEQWVDNRPNAELLLELASTLGKLPNEFREALLLKDLQQLTLQELADETGISLPAAKSRVRRARLQARSLLLANE